MEELARHIENLLLDNDCVIVPGVGGFITYRQQAEKTEQDGVFNPPCRVIGFNPLLKLNDGLLTQSYMSVYNTSYFEANKTVEKQSRDLLSSLYENGKAELQGIGGIKCDINGKLSFTPYNSRLSTPSLYGFDSFDMKELKDLRNIAVPDKTSSRQRAVSPNRSLKAKHKKDVASVMRTTGRYAVNAAAFIAILVLSMFLSTQIDKFPSSNAVNADLMPKEMISQIKQHSLAVSPTMSVVKSENDVDEKAPRGIEQATATTQNVENTLSSDVVAKDNADTKNDTKKQGIDKPLVAKKLYNVIVASVGSEDAAKSMVSDLSSKGYDGAKIIVGDGKIRVSIMSFEAERDAYSEINKKKLSDNMFKDAWVLRR